ncbi:MAG: type II secretion system F family protein [Planctomycetes bacterium]|nr:type II secretion system F family protein [Planctomycetota bacterium]
MATFLYKAIDAQGRQVADKLVAADRASAIDQLFTRKLNPVTVERQEDIPAGGALARRGRVSKAEVESFTRQLANLLAAGIPLSRALSILSHEAAKPAAARLWATVHDQVAGGMPLADALSLHPRAFPPVNVAMVRAGETGGFLDVVLEQIATFRAREQELKDKVASALLYPVILSVLATGILVFLLIYFIPRFSTMFAEYGGSLPGLTKAIVAVSGMAVRYWFVLVIAVVLLVFGIRRVRSSQEGRRLVERAVLRSPLFGRAVARFALVRFCRMLGTLVGAGVPLVAALRVAKEAIGNQVLADTVDGAIEDVQRGVSLARSLERSKELFPNSVIEMVAVAEESGRLDKELTRLAGAYEQELDRYLKMLVAMAEPALLFVMAALVGTIVIGMILPIFNMQELIR